jgi:SAM-dependent methyltransferase
MAKRFYTADLAELHNLYYADFVENAAPGAITILREAQIRGGTVLDLGCGGGQLSSLLLHRGYSPVGVDVSRAMIRLARQQVPKARFIHGSISNIALPRCGAAIAIGEVFNYLPSKAEIRRALRNVFHALEPGGILIFDVKEPLPGPGKKARSSARWGHDWAIFVEVEEDPRRQRLTRKILTFRKEGNRYRREEEVHGQTIIPAADMAAMLASIGFSVGVQKGYRSFRVSDDRKVLIARKSRLETAATTRR